jgi:type IV secretion system protein VirB4
MLFLKEYQTRPKQLADYLTYAALPFENHQNVKANKDGSYSCFIRYRGPDMASRTVSEMDVFYVQMNDILMRLEDKQGSAWCEHWDLNRHEISAYDVAEWNNLGSYLFDMERYGHATKLGAQFESECTLTLTFLPASDRMTILESLLEEPDPNETDEEREIERQVSALDYFVRRTEEIVDLLQARMGKGSVRFLYGGEIITYLNEAVTLQRHKLDLPEVPMFLDSLLATREIWPGTTLGIGYDEDDFGNPHPEQYIAMVGIKKWPKATQGGFIDVLNSLNIPYRWTTRAIPLSHQSSLEVTGDFMDKWASQRKGIKAVMAEHIFKTTVDREDSSAVANYNDAKEAVGRVARGEVNMAYTTPTVTVWGDTKKEAEKKAKAIVAILNSAGFKAFVEKFNAFEAWLGSLPGQCYPNVRQAPISTENLSHISPLTGVWAGYEWCEALNGPPLMRCFTDGSTPFRLSFYHGDVGHTKIIGPNGAGKSVLLSSVCYQFFRYPEARIFAFDKDRSIRACTLLCGGKFHDFGLKKDKKSVGLQALANIHIPSERKWARDWLVDLYISQGVEITPKKKDEITKLLKSMSMGPANERNLSIFKARIKGDLKDALSDFVGDGPYAHLLDSDKNELEPHHFHAFEMGALMKSHALVPVLTCLFHWIDGQIRQTEKDAPPTLIILDESWTYIDNAMFAAQFKTWLKTVRKFNVSVIFATQSIGDSKGSAIEDAADDNVFTTVWLPNAGALEPDTYEKYAAKGLNHRQITNIAHAIPKREYWYQSDAGDRMFELGLGDLGLALAGSSSTRDHRIMDAILEKFGEDEFVQAFLVAKGVGWAAEMIQEGSTDMYPDAATLLGEIEEEIAA